MAHHFTDNQTSFSDSTDPNMGMIMNNIYPLFNPSETDMSSTWSIQSIMGFSPEESFLPQPPLINGNFQGFLPTDEKSDVSAAQNMVSGANDHVGKKRKSVDTPESSSANSSGPASDNGIDMKNSTGKGKKVKYNVQNEGKRPKDVVHVRARRGQATDSHSLAERVRRGKINERLRCLQDIVPGCHKTMGMAVMLDEIINYVQSLQNQVEFLSMKLTAASTFHDFDTETNQVDIMMLRDKACEAAMIQNLLRERCEIGEGGFMPHSNQSGPFDLSFGCHPSMPYNK